MLTQEVTPQMIKAWKDSWNEYKDKLHPNRKSGTEVIEYLKNKYPLQEIHDDKATRVVIDNVLANKPFCDKLPDGAVPLAKTFMIENIDTGKVLYEKQEDVYNGSNIFVGIDTVSGYFCVEGSSLLWDELYAFRGLDESDIQNYYCVAEYISCLKRFGLLKSILR